jgi:hypothetical protein
MDMGIDLANIVLMQGEAMKQLAREVGKMASNHMIKWTYQVAYECRKQLMAGEVGKVASKPP